jgi:hypothetical protein
MNLEPASVAGKPRPDCAVFVVRGVVLHEYCASLPIVRCKSPKKPQVGLRVEDRVGAVVELSPVDLNRTENLDALTFPGHWDFWRLPDSAPRRVERRVLAEARFVREEEPETLALGFFFRFG